MSCPCAGRLAHPTWPWRFQCPADLKKQQSHVLTAHALRIINRRKENMSGEGGRPMQHLPMDACIFMQRERSAEERGHLSCHR